jgi:hypothetical protein
VELVTWMGEMTIAYRILVGNLNGNAYFGRRVCSWKDNVKVDLEYDMRVWTGFKWLII